ncbi:hypothetical protein [Nocardioides aurantiacus]|uniref:Uncharacterized protein n=1 Tax=Nocardioides aurantiacus TaxID=86796 RepID=A0A3N2CRR6_9ACTN|nr:hypothetical protein [Nocardioides aurantiacus]ROR90243.1 hypothetical protein EDD33_1079 [Nocardioides aurantiacus]
MAPTTVGVPAVADGADERYRLVAAGCAIIAGAIHALVVPEHMAESVYAGAFFVVVAVGQFSLALVLRQIPDPRVLVAAVAGTLAVVVLYVVSSTVGLPFLPVHDHAAHAGEHLPVAGAVGDGTPVYPTSGIEPVGPLALICLGAELVLIAMLVGLLNGPRRQVVLNVLLGTGVLALGARAAGLLG